MTGTGMLDAAIGVIFVILGFSLVASALQEALAGVLNWRGRMLRRGLFRLLEGAAAADLVDLPFPGGRMRRATLTQAVLADPAIRVLHGPAGVLSRLWERVAGRGRDGGASRVGGLGRLPSAIPAESFARALVDTLVRRVDLSGVRGIDGLSLENAEAAAMALDGLAEELSEEADRALRAADGALAAMPLDPALRDRLRRAVGRIAAAREVRARLDRAGRTGEAIRARVDALIAAAEAGVAGVLDEIGAWFDRAMDRVSGWYARRARLTLFAIGATMALAVNLNLAEFGERVLSDPELRVELVERAKAQVEAGLPEAGSAGGDDAAIETVSGARERIAALPGHGGAGFGRTCAPGEGWLACFWRTLSLGSAISWLVVGLGCMMGGQFWYDLLGVMLRFRPVAGTARRV